MKAKETRTINIDGIPCTFKIYDTYVVAIPPLNRFRNIVEMIRAGDETCDPAIRRLAVIANREWKNLSVFVNATK